MRLPLRAWKNTLTSLGYRARNIRRTGRQLRNHHYTFETLQERTLLTVSATYNTSAIHTLTVTGDTANNTIVISSENVGGNDYLRINGSDLGLGNILAADVEQILLNGGDGNDTLDLSEVNSTEFSSLWTTSVSGDAGNDTIYGAPIDAIDSALSGGDGNDWIYGCPFAAHLLSTIEGNDGDDHLFGTEGVDWIDGGAGNDFLDGLHNDDSLSGGAGDDTYSFENANGYDNKYVYEDAGLDSDTLEFLASIDLQSTSSQTTAGMASLTLSDGEGIENVISTGGDIYGNGRDNMLSSSGALYGRAGNDILIGTGGAAQSLSGGDGDDTFVLQPSGGSDSYAIYDDANQGSDTLDLSNYTGNLTINIGSTAAQTVLSGSLTVTLETSTSIENVIGGSGGNTVYGNARDNTLTGGSGADTLIGGNGNDYLYGLGGNDWLDGQDGDDHVYGGGGADYMVGTAGQNYLAGGGDSDIYLYYAVSGTTNDTIDESSSGGTSDEISFIYEDVGVTFDLADGSAQTVIEDRVTITLAHPNEVEWLEGTTFSDALYGNAQTNLIYGRAGNDYIDPRGGDDFVTAGDGDDTLNASTGNDYVDGDGGNDTFIFDASLGNLGGEYVGEGANADSDTLDFSSFSSSVTINLSDTGGSTQTVVSGALIVALLGTTTGTGFENVIGGSGDDTITGNTRDNYVYGGAGDDIISTGNGNDIIFGAAGDDTMTGGAGNDTYVFDPFFGSLGTDSITEAANADTDTIDFANFSTDITFTLNSNSSQNVGGMLTLYLSDAAGIENLVGGMGDDTLTGNARANYIDGRRGADLILGGDGNDRIWGGAGNDELRGNAGSDALFGGLGDDTLYAGTGNDYLFGEAGDDILNDRDQVGSMTEGGDDYLDGGWGDDTLTALSGNDTLIGGTGNDTLYGGTGNDTYTYSWIPGQFGLGGDVVYEDSSEGSDVLDFTNFQADDYAAPDLSNDDPQEISADVLTIDLEGDSLPTIETVNDPADVIARVNGLVVDSQSDPGNITLFTFTAVEFGGSGVDSVNFYLDSNDNGVWDGGDTLLGTDSDGSDGWSTTVGASTIPSGQHKYFATAVGTISGEGPAEETPPIENGGGIGGGGPGGPGGGPGAPGGPRPGGPGGALPPAPRPLAQLIAFPNGGVGAAVNGIIPASTNVITQLGPYQFATANDAGAGNFQAFALDTASLASDDINLNHAQASHVGSATAAGTPTSQAGFGTNGLASAITTASITGVANGQAILQVAANSNYDLFVDSTIAGGQVLPFGTQVIINVYTSLLVNGTITTADPNLAFSQVSAGWTVGPWAANITTGGQLNYFLPTGSGTVQLNPLSGGFSTTFQITATVGDWINGVGGATANIAQAQAYQNALDDSATATAGGLFYVQMNVVGFIPPSP